MNLIIVKGVSSKTEETYILGAANSIQNAENLIVSYFAKGKYLKAIASHVKGDSIATKIVEITQGKKATVSHTIALEWVILNEAHQLTNGSSK